MSVVLLEDHVLVRQGVRSVLEGSGEAVVVGEGNTAAEGLEVLSTTKCDLVILDLNLPGENGIWCAARLRELYPDLPVLILSLHTQKSTVLEAVKAGARGFVAKSSPPSELLAAVRALTFGGSYFDASTAPAVLSSIRGEERGEIGLSSRQEQILRLLCRGLSNQQIADSMNLSQSSIKNSIRELFLRFQVSDRAALVSACESDFRRESLQIPRR